MNAFDRRIDLFDPLFPAIPRLLAHLRSGDLAAALPVDISEDDSSYTIRADVPGAQREDVDVSIEGRKVTISVKPASTAQPEGPRLLLQERHAVPRSRLLQLPQAVIEDHCTANLADGVLTVKLAKARSGGTRKISVQ